ncbi:MAG: RelA/SpoT domain-containing protein [Limisphaerales bacterium]
MAYEKPLYDRPAVNAAVRQLLEDRATDETRAIIENWRNSHFLPHAIFSTTLEKKAAKIDPHAVVSLRRKRLKSILKKLREKPAMRFTQMQDIAGSRAVVTSLEAVYALEHAYERSWVGHELQKRNDYISEPRATGYRSLHLCTHTRARAREMRSTMDLKSNYS